MLNSLANFKIKKGEPNFLIGVAGNGLSTSIQQEIFTNEFKNIHYLNYINLSDTSEAGILLEFINAIVTSVTGLKLTPELIEGYHTPFNIFKAGIEAINKDNQTEFEITIIFDEFQRIHKFSNAFFFTLDKILSITQIIPNIKVTSILISDEYINPQNEPLAEGIGKLFFHYMNFDIIPAKTYEQMCSNKVKPLDNYTDTQKQHIFKLGGFIPSLLVSIVDTNYIQNQSLENHIIQDYELEWKLQEVWDSIGKDNQLVLKEVLVKRKVTCKNLLQKRFLVETGVIDDQMSRIVPQLLQNYIKQMTNLGQIDNDDYIDLNGIKIFLPDLSPHQEDILLLLHEKRGKLVSRYEIARQLWGPDFLDKYSDYAIDKQISKLRKILEEKTSNPNVLVTKKGKGYILMV